MAGTKRRFSLRFGFATTGWRALAAALLRSAEEL